MIAATDSATRERAERMRLALRQSGVSADVASVDSTVGGGSLPGETLPSWAIVLGALGGEGVEALARRMRIGSPAVFGRIDRNRLLLDLRTVLPEDDESLQRAIRAAFS
jgi:L-seryl-tRNA(Ser) seleniumtransferase